MTISYLLAGTVAEEVMEDNHPPSVVLDGKVVGIKFSMATSPEIVSN